MKFPVFSHGGTNLKSKSPRRPWLAGDTARPATSDEVKDLRCEASAVKEAVAELMLENRLLKKSTIGAWEDGA